MLTDHTTTIISPASLAELKDRLFNSWIYADVDFIIDDTDVPIQGFEMMQRVSISLRAIAIMNQGDIDRQKLWQSVRPILSCLLDNRWEVHVGDCDGCLCVRVYDPQSVDHAGAIEFDVPPDGVRQLRNVDAWSSSWGYFS